MFNAKAVSFSCIIQLLALYKRRCTGVILISVSMHSYAYFYFVPIDPPLVSNPSGYYNHPHADVSIQFFFNVDVRLGKRFTVGHSWRFFQKPQKNRQKHRHVRPVMTSHQRERHAIILLSVKS